MMGFEMKKSTPASRAASKSGASAVPEIPITIGRGLPGEMSLQLPFVSALLEVGKGA